MWTTVAVLSLIGFAVAVNSECMDWTTKCDQLPIQYCTGQYEQRAREACPLRCGYCSGGVSIERRNHNQPIWLEHCWDQNDHLKDPFCDRLTSTTTTTTTTTTPAPTTTTTTEPTTTTTTEPTTTTTTEPTTTTTTLPPTTTARHCNYVSWEKSGIDSITTDLLTPIQSANSSRNSSAVHVKGSIENCKNTCERSFQEPDECWAITYSKADQCYLYYYSRPLYVDEQKHIMHAMNGSTLYLKRCSDDPITPAPAKTSSTSTVMTTKTPIVTETSTMKQTPAVTDAPTAGTSDTTPNIVTQTPAVTGAPTVTDVSTEKLTTKSAAAQTTAPMVTHTVIDTSTTNATMSVVMVTDTSTSKVTVAQTQPSTDTGSRSTPSHTTNAATTPIRTPPPTPSINYTGGPLSIQKSGPMGGVTVIDNMSYMIQGIPTTPNPNTCYFISQSFGKGDHWKTTCRYDCECTNVQLNQAICKDICPILTPANDNCQIVKLPGQCCAERQCDNTTIPTNTTTDGCHDVLDTCDYYPDHACKDVYEPWARANCPLRCGYCPGKVAPCTDRLSYCNLYDMGDACTMYPGWARYNCKASCNFCQAP